jgi:hypothetical protein
MPFQDEFSAFRHTEPMWLERYPKSEAVYAIPWPLFSSGQLESLFTPSELMSERQFAAICRRHSFIGIRGEQPISFAPLLPAVIGPSTPERQGTSNDGAPNTPQIQMMNRLLDGSDERRLGIAGFLSTEPAFLNEFKALQTLAVECHGHEGISWPQPRPDPESSTSQYRTRLSAFMDKWCLSQIATWDWALPHGPLVPDDLAPSSSARPKNGVSIWVPSSYPLVGDDELFRKLRNLQKYRAEALGMSAMLVNLQHHEQYAQMARIIHLDTTLRSRFSVKPPRGYAGALDILAAKYIHTTAGVVKRSRKWIAKCRRGERDTILKLRIKA